MRHRAYVWWCVAVVALGAFFLVGNLVLNGVSVWDFSPLVFAPLGVLAVALIRRDRP